MVASDRGFSIQIMDLSNTRMNAYIVGERLKTSQINRIKNISPREAEMEKAVSGSQRSNSEKSTENIYTHIFLINKQVYLYRSEI